ncbi:MAG: ribosome maturation factor RimP [Candidatus Hydrogenedentota bacterium]|nr:MAG: ribosome maturation factor RimP [Candidatus Hydrogenedentota bacterium]
MESTAEMVVRVVERAIESEGYSLVDLELKRDGGTQVLRLFIDKPEGGITLDDCQKVSHLLSPMLDIEDVVEGRYFLEISSPGINRRIKKRADFERFAGSKVKIHVRSPIDGRRKITGIIEGVEGESVIIRHERPGSKGLSRVPFAAISRANLQII